MSWKYVIMRAGNREVPIIFPSNQVHATMAAAFVHGQLLDAQFLAHGMLSGANLQELAKAITVVSAGDCELNVMHAGGNSVTLGIKSRPDDKDAINLHPYTHGLTDEVTLEETRRHMGDVITMGHGQPTVHWVVCPVCQNYVNEKSVDHTLVDVSTCADQSDTRFVVAECRKGKL